MILKWSRGSSVSINTRLRTGWPGFNNRKGQVWDFLSPSPLPDRLRGPLSLLSIVNGGLMLWAKSSWSLKLTTHLHPVTRSRMRESIPPILQYVSMAWYLINQWIRLHGVVLSFKHKTTLPFFIFTTSKWDIVRLHGTVFHALVRYCIIRSKCCSCVYIHTNTAKAVPFLP
jgi:hypothetical protein